MDFLCDCLGLWAQRHKVKAKKSKKKKKERDRERQKEEGRKGGTGGGREEGRKKRILTWSIRTLVGCGSWPEALPVFCIWSSSNFTPKLYLLRLYYKCSGPHQTLQTRFLSRVWILLKKNLVPVYGWVTLTLKTHLKKLFDIGSSNF